MFFDRVHPVIPAFGSFMWCGGLMAMIITWRAQGRPHYVSETGNIPFISDIGADILKPLFIVVCVITSISFVLSLSMERWLRHSGRLHPNMRTREKVFASLAIFGALLGGAGLILLSIFDTKRHMELHRVFLLIFMVGVAISAIFTVLEFRWLNKQYTHSSKLRRSYLTKAGIVMVLVILAIVFGSLMDSKPNVGAILEWVIAFGFTFYLLTFFFDLRMAKQSTNDELNQSLTAKY
ncbi:hypothetical protein K439DRAFT_1329151 [Ramaria rubella]|nr:hypothetical protein K439DRAFT_1329151 [Ramaria rubella]